MVDMLSDAGILRSVGTQVHLCKQFQCAPRTLGIRGCSMFNISNSGSIRGRYNNEAKQQAVMVCGFKLY